jgi:hypothetical protein
LTMRLAASLLTALLASGCMSLAERCRDGARDGDESDVDCGGSCSTCGVDRRCGAAADCFTGVCKSGSCAAPDCADGVKNGDESDIDCGGRCDLCIFGRHCLSDGDCTSHTCDQGRCVVPFCQDHKHDSDETDVDCGGATCPLCDRGRGCKLPTDCKSAECTAGVCTSACPPGSESCDHDPMNGCETHTDYDPANCGACGNVCPKNSPFCVGGTCTYVLKASVGGFAVGEGPDAASHPAALSYVETCAMRFGSTPDDYVCSTLLSGIDRRAFVDGVDDPTHCTQPVADDYKLGDTYGCAAKGCAYSAFVKDHAECASAMNWCFR